MADGALELFEYLEPAYPHEAGQKREYPPRQLLPEIGLMGIGLHAISKAECVDYILSELEAERGGVVVTPNLDHLRRLLKDDDFRAICEQADLRVADGKPIVWACRLQRTPLPERVAGSDLISCLSRGAAREGRSIYLLGGNEGTAEAAAEVLKTRFEGLRIAGTVCPPMGFERDPLLMGQLSMSLREADPDIVFVALGSPKQERVIQILREELPRAWWLGVGISFSFVCGDVQRAPKWMQSTGLEWLHRFSQEPTRLFKRYFVHGIPFAVSLLSRSLVRGILPKGKHATLYGQRKPRALLVDDDSFALDHLELLLSTHFPEVEFEKRTRADVSGRFDFYFIDNDFDGEKRAARLASKVRAEWPDALIFAFSAELDGDTLKSLINAGCNGVCDKNDLGRWKPVLDQVRENLATRAAEHRQETAAFGGVRHAAGSIQMLLRDWNGRNVPLKEDSKKLL